MKRQRTSQLRWQIPVIMLFLVCSLPLAALEYLTKLVPAAGASHVDLFQIEIAPGSIGTDEVDIAKFVVDDTAADLEFRVETSDTARYHITDFRISLGNVALMDEDTTEQVASLRVRDLTGTEEAAPGKRIIKISITFTNEYAFADAAVTPVAGHPGLAELWIVKARKPAAGTLHYWGFHERGTGDANITSAVTRPKLIEYIDDVTNFGVFTDFPAVKNISFGGVHVDINDTLAPRELYQFINVGTAKLDIIGVSPAAAPGGAYSVTNYPGTAADVLPLAAFTGTEFKCVPTGATNPALGPVPDANITITTNLPGTPNLQINLTNNRAVRLNTALLLDFSGSMLTDIHGVASWNESAEPINPENVRKIWHAREAGRLLKEVYNALLPSGRFGLFTYPDLEGNCPGSQMVVALQTISSNHMFVDANLNNANPARIAPLNNYFLTPMAEGIKMVYNNLPRGVQDERCAVVMIGDGQHSCDSDAPDAVPADWEPELTDSGIKFYTVPYGDNNAAWTQQLADIAAWTNGFMYSTNLLSLMNEGDLRRNHEKIIRDILELEPLIDPEGTIGLNQNKSHAVCVSQDDYTLTFIVRWDAQIANALSVQLQTPAGAAITPGTALTAPADVVYFTSGSYAGYVVRGRYLAGRAGVGSWKIQLRGSSSLSSGQTVPYAYSVYAQSRLKSSYNFNIPHTGAKGVFDFIIGDNQHMVQSFNTVTEFKAPGLSFGTYLSTSAVDPDLILKAPDEIDGNKASLADKKYYVLANILKKPYDPAYTTIKAEPGQNKEKGRTLPISYKQERYSVALDNTRIAGLYELKARVQGITLNGDCFEREVLVIRDVEMRIDRELIQRTVKFQAVRSSPFTPPWIMELIRERPPAGMRRISIVFTPKDEFGNYWGPGNAGKISFKVKNAEPIGTIVDNLDGSYSQVIQYDQKMAPGVIVAARGVESAEIPMSSQAAPELSFHAGYALLHGSPGNYSGISGALDLGYRLTKNLSVEAVAGFHFFFLDDTGNSTYWINTSVNGRYSYPIGILRLFVNGGGGWYFPQTGNSAAGWNIGGGLGVELNPGLALELGYNYHNALITGNVRFSAIQLGARLGI